MSRRGYAAIATLGKTPNADVICTNLEGTKSVYILVRTYLPGGRTCSVGRKAESNFGENYFWILCGLPLLGTNDEFEYFVIPSKIMFDNIQRTHHLWIQTPGIHGQKHHENDVRMVVIPPYTSKYGWDIWEYRNNWKLIEDKLT